MRGESYGVGYLVRDAPSPSQKYRCTRTSGSLDCEADQGLLTLQNCLDLAGVARVIRKSQGQDEYNLST